MSTSYQDKFVDIGINKIHYLDSGTVGSGEILILLPGWPVSCSMFDEFINIMASKYRCLALDLPGWGKSTDMERQFNGIDYNVDFLDKFIEKVIPGESFSIFGYSTGGVLGVLYSYKYKKDTALIVYSPPLDGIDHMKRRFKRSKKQQLLYMFFRTFPLLLNLLKTKPAREKIVSSMIKGDGNIGGVSKRQKNLIKEIILASQNLSLKAIFDIAIDLKRNNYVPLLNNINQKILFMSSTNDKAVSFQEVEGFVKQSVNGQVHIFDDYDHFIILKNPRILAGVVDSFLNGKNVA